MIDVVGHFNISPQNFEKVCLWYVSGHGHILDMREGKGHRE